MVVEATLQLQQMEEQQVMDPKDSLAAVDVD
jgi:hypothetical protein